MKNKQISICKLNLILNRSHEEIEKKKQRIKKKIKIIL